MNSSLKKIGEALRVFYGWGIMLILFAGGLTSIGYLIAFCVNQKEASIICEFIYKCIIPHIIYLSSIIVLIGLVSMYLCRESALSVSDSKNK